MLLVDGQLPVIGKRRRCLRKRSARSVKLGHDVSPYIALLILVANILMLLCTFKHVKGVIYHHVTYLTNVVESSILVQTLPRPNTNSISGS